MVHPGLYRDAHGVLHQVLDVIPSDENGVSQVMHRNLTTDQTSVCAVTHFEEILMVDSASRPRFVAVGSTQDFHRALEDVFTRVLEQARARRQADGGYAHLFSAARDQGTWSAIMAASDQMQEVVSNLEAVLYQIHGHHLPAEAYRMIEGLPLLFSVVRQDIQDHEGSSCVADKTRHVLRLYFQELLEAPLDSLGG